MTMTAQISLSNLRYSDAEGVNIDMDITAINAPPFAPGEVLPFTYNPADTAPMTLAVKALLEAPGADYEIAAYTPPE